MSRQPEPSRPPAARVGLASSLARVFLLGLVLGLLLLLGLRPWFATLGLWPMAADSPDWFRLSDPAAPGWRDWVFHTRHFGVGYRPLTALTFSATTAWADGSAFVARLTDLVLHALAALGVYALGRALAPRSSRLGPVVALALFLAHPIAGEVVPILARRSYSLSLALSTWSLVGVAAGVRAGSGGLRFGIGLAAGVGFAAAWFANEVAAIAVLASPLVAWASAPAGSERGRARVKAAALVLVPAAVPVLVAVVLRARVLGELGGYDVDEDSAASATTIAAASLRQLLGVSRGQPLAGALGAATFPASAAASVGALAAALLALRACGRAAVEARRVVVVGVVWLALGVATYAALGVLYPRQVYVLVPPLALALGLPLGSAVRGVRGAPLAATLALHAVAAAGIASASPALHGQDARRLALWRERQVVMEALVEAGRGVDEPAALVLVLPATERGGEKGRGRGGGARLHAVDMRSGGRRRAFVRWVDFELRGRDVLLEEFLEVSGEPLPGADPATVERSGARAFLVLPEGVEARAVAGKLPRDRADPRRIRVSTSGERLRSRYVFVLIGETWTLEPL